jgi:hypothetical protein
MLKRTAATILVLAFTVWASIGCTTLVAAYLVDQLLNNKAPTYLWTGTVTDQSGRKLSGLTVKVEATASGDTKILTYDGTTDDSGEYSIKFRWSNQIDYTLRISDADGNVLYTHDFGTVDGANKTTDVTVTGSVGVELSGVVTDAAGNPVPGAVVIAATADSLTATPSVLVDSASDPVWTQTNDAGIFSITGTLNTYGIVCAFEPDHGFAYNYGTDADHNGQIAVNMKMGGAGRYQVNAQVVDANGDPIVNRVLDPGQKFRVRGSVKFDLSETMDSVVHNNSLFPALLTKPSVQQPPDFNFTVEATGVDGIAAGLQNVEGGAYAIDLLNVDADTPATALVTSGNPLVLADDATIVVRVN